MIVITFKLLSSSAELVFVRAGPRSIVLITRMHVSIYLSGIPLVIRSRLLLPNLNFWHAVQRDRERVRKGERDKVSSTLYLHPMRDGNREEGRGDKVLSSPSLHLIRNKGWEWGREGLIKAPSPHYLHSTMEGGSEEWKDGGRQWWGIKFSPSLLLSKDEGKERGRDGGR